MFAKTVNKTLCRLTLVETFPNTLSEVVARQFQVQVKAEAPVKTDGDVDAGLKAYTDVAIINEFEAVALVHLKAYTFS